MSERRNQIFLKWLPRKNTAELQIMFPWENQDYMDII